MRRVVIPLFIAGAIAALTVACYGRAVFHGEQFAYRDAAHYYYPLNQRVQAEWNAGRWPLWEPEENSGMPLLGNPTAAVLYPGKLVFALFPYPLAARVYVIMHTLFAVASMLALLRTWGVSWTGSSLGAMAYAFGGPILFQHCNIIFLVGAAWAPLGFRAVDRWLRLGRTLGMLELAVVLAMETLGGDPESAYLTGLAAAPYALAMAWARRRDAQPTPVARPGWFRGHWWVAPVVVSLVAAWMAATLAIAQLVPRLRTHKDVAVALPWMPWVPPMVVLGWCVFGLALLLRWRKRRPEAGQVLVPMLAGLVASAALAGAVTAAQLLPVIEFTGLTARAAGEGPHDIYPFSLSPLRVIEFLWPNVFGTTFQGNRSWLSVVPPVAKYAKVWVPTLYVGGLTTVLALAATRWRGRGEPWRAWMTAVAAVSLLGAFGEYTSPLLWARYVPELKASLGPLDPVDTGPIRSDDHLRDGDGSLYWMMATVLPGFRQFRFPSKLLTFTVLGIAALAARGWDDLFSDDPGTRRRSVVWASTFLVLTLAGLAAVSISRADFLAWLGQRASPSSFGPLDVPGAWGEMARGLGQCAVVMVAALTVTLGGRRWPRLASAVALLVMAADLGLANACHVVTVPQSLLDEPPEVLVRIRDAEARRPSPGPYRIHRTPVWNPVIWIDQTSKSRVRDFLVWEHGTLQPKYGINDGVHFTTTLGVAELFDYEFYFAGFPRSADAAMARALRVAPGTDVIYQPRRAFDMWTTRYFVLPYYPKWSDEHRGIAAFLDQTERIYPPMDAFQGPGGRDREIDWIKNHDYQILRNLSVYPRAWVVHGGRFLPPIAGMNREDRQRPMEEILFANDLIWKSPTRVVYDPKTMAWLEADDRVALRPYLHGSSDGSVDDVRVDRYESDRVEIEADLARPGLVVLADVFYPGWTLTIDGKPAPVHRVNRMMRGAGVEAGKHRLVYLFRPWRFRVGLIVSGVGLGLLVVLGVVFAFRPVFPILEPLRRVSVVGADGAAGLTGPSDDPA
jgi:Bacterial membrane protein YfhO